MKKDRLEIMKKLSAFEELAARARAETAPAPDVSRAVMARVRREAAIGGRRGVAAGDAGGLPMWSVAAALLVVGFATALAGYGSWSEWSGSVYAWMPDFSSWGWL